MSWIPPLGRVLALLVLGALAWPGASALWVAATAAGIWLLLGAGSWAGTRRLLVPSLALLGSIALSSVLSPERAAPGPILACLLVVAGTSRAATRDRDLGTLLVSGLTGLASVVLLLTLVQAAVHPGADRPGGFAGLVHWGGYPEIGLLGVLVVPLLLSAALCGQAPSLAIGGAALAVPAVGGLLLSLARAAWVAAAAGAVVVAAYGRRRRTLVLAAVLLPLVGFLALSTPRVTSLARQLVWADASGANAAVDMRVQVWRSAAAMWRERWLLGWGPGTYRAAFRRSQGRPVWPGMDRHAHNTPLHLLVEIGAVGFLAAAWYAWIVLSGAAGGLGCERGTRRVLRVGLLAALVGAVVRMQIDYFDPAAGPERVLIVLALLTGVAMSLVECPGASEPGALSQGPGVPDQGR